MNGRIQAVSRSVRIRRRAGEYYSFLVPPAALVRGNNVIEVFAVSRVRGRLFGSPLYP